MRTGSESRTATAYKVAGKVVTNAYVRAACQRHLDDLIADE